MTNITNERVRYAETDAMGITHHATYLLWMEMGRTNLLRQVGFPYKKLEEDGIMLPVSKVGVKYFKPTYYDDPIAIHSTCTLLKGVRMRIDYKMYRNEELVATGYSEHGIIDSHTRKLKKAPDYLLDEIVVPDDVENYINKI